LQRADGFSELKSRGLHKWWGGMAWVSRKRCGFARICLQGARAGRPGEAKGLRLNTASMRGAGNPSLTSAGFPSPCFFSSAIFPSSAFLLFIFATAGRYRVNRRLIGLGLIESSLSLIRLCARRCSTRRGALMFHTSMSLFGPSSDSPALLYYFDRMQYYFE
jgi:hypothetical protein